MNRFYVTLPSNSSANYYTENTVARYTKKLVNGGLATRRRLTQQSRVIDMMGHVDYSTLLSESTSCGQTAVDIVSVGEIYTVHVTTRVFVIEG